MILPARTPRADVGRAVSRPLLAGALTLALAAAAAAGAAPAEAASTWPAHPTGVHQSAAGSSWITVSARTSAHARSYTVYASTYRPDLYYANLVHGHASSKRHAATAGRPAVTITGWRYSTAPIYYRLVARNGSHKASYSSGIGTAGLAPSTPSSLVAHSSSTRTYLTWNSVAASGFTVVQATNAAMTTGRRSYSINDTSGAFSPSGLVNGTRYYFAVRALNGPTPSHFSQHASVVVQSREQSVRVMSYNVLHLAADGTKESGNTVAAWSQRKVAAAALITSARPDIAGVQEGGDWVSVKTVRQVDSLRSQLARDGYDYTVAHTEAAFGQPGYVRTGNYILYSSAYRAVGAGGNWRLYSTANVWAVYQELENVSTGARLLVVNTHLTQPGGHANDLLRRSETQAMLSHANSLAASQDVPVVYLGDYNSNSNPALYSLDGPGSVMRSTQTADARLVAQSHVNPNWDSINDYMRAPYHYSLYWDYIWLSAGVSATQWGMAVRISGGKFVGVIPSDHNPIWAQLSFGY